MNVKLLYLCTIMLSTHEKLYLLIWMFLYVVIVYLASNRLN